MAEMIPPDVQAFKTEGERQVYGFLAKVGKPDNRYIAWYMPDVNDLEPDFILYSEKAGIIVLEVKDWGLEQIEGADPDNFYLKQGKGRETRKNPRRQARDYLNAIIDKIKKDGQLLSKDPVHHGNPGVPLDCGVIFPNYLV